MSDAFYLKPEGELRQGDISFAYVSQLVPRNSQLGWPGPAEPPELPAYGDYHLLKGPENAHGYPDYHVHVWPMRVIVVTQSCDLTNAHEQDSRVVVAPIVSEDSWDLPEFWAQVQSGVQVPGFFYLPQLSEQAAATLNLEPGDLGPAVVDLASSSLGSRELVTRRRIARLAPEVVVSLQDAIARAFTVRGLASTRELDGLQGRTILSAKETPLTSPGPVRLVKVHMSGTETSPEDEMTVAWGVRKSLSSPDA